MKLPLLYKRTRTTAIQFWEIDVTAQADGTAIITKTSGQYGTDKPLENIEHVQEGKNLGRANQTTPLEQAKSQAESDWKKKKDQGYKTIEDLGIEWVQGTTASAFSYNNTLYSTLKNALEEALPTYMTDAQGNVKPMLAKSVNWKKVNYGCLVMPKYDGVRCLCIFDGEKVTMLSRTGKTYSTLPHITKELEDSLTKPIILDGEIYAHGLTFQEIVACVKKYRDESLTLRYMVYDVVSDSTQVVRWETISSLFATNSWLYSHVVPGHLCINKEEVLKLHDHYVQEGYEGVMVRLLDGSYDQGQRSSNLLKVKEYDSNEFPFLDFELGQRGVEDLIAVCIAGSKDGAFKAKMQGTVAQKEALYNNKPPQMTPLTIKHFGYTNDGLPRFPIGVTFRDYE
jgi:DNA ligase-1